jgi:hypothetical protein
MAAQSLSAMGLETVLFVCALFTATGLFAVVRRGGRSPGDTENTAR